MQLLAGIDSLGLPRLLGNAERRIILHAAIYGPFALSAEYGHAFDKALGKASFERLDIITLTADSEVAWKARFLDMLRHGAKADEQRSALHDSDSFLKKLAMIAPSKVILHPIRSLPCQPIMIVDDTIVFGQYAHCAAYAAQGFWGITTADVGRLLDRAAKGSIPPGADNEEIAAYRLVCECHNAMIPEGP